MLLLVELLALVDLAELADLILRIVVCADSGSICSRLSMSLALGA